MKTKKSSLSLEMVTVNEKRWQNKECRKLKNAVKTNWVAMFQILRLLLACL